MMIQHDKSTCLQIVPLLIFLIGVHDDKHMWGLPSHKMTWRWSSFLHMALSSIFLHVICPQHGFLLLTQEILLG
ncbi:unnamed protein product [Sphagnum jensenii]|uniref:Uncharacterized protein n=1 Tax=Sphagnum jensenii TaxID=128206 RepID=A0ABP0WVQ1_9BRYO